MVIRIIVFCFKTVPILGGDSHRADLTSCNYVHNFAQVPYQNDNTFPTSRIYPANYAESHHASRLVGVNRKEEVFVRIPQEEKHGFSHIPILSINEIWKPSVIDDIIRQQQKLVIIVMNSNYDYSNSINIFS